MDGALALVVGMAFTLVRGLYPYDPRVLVGTFLMASFFALELDGRNWALTESSKGGSLILFGEELMLDIGLDLGLLLSLLWAKCY